MKKVAIVASASGNGKTTLGKALASRLGVPLLELDSLVHRRREWPRELAHDPVVRLRSQSQVERYLREAAP